MMFAMNQVVAPGALRHSKTHRAGAARMLARMVYAWTIILPAERFRHGFSDRDQKMMYADLMNLPGGATVMHAAYSDHGNTVTLIVHAPGTWKPMLPAHHSASAKRGRRIK